MVLISGYYGFGNLGDEAILQALVSDLISLGVKRSEIVVLSIDPKRTEAEHGVRALPRYNLKKIWQALGSARLLVSGGGSLLQDVTSKRSIPYYLGVVELALLRKVRVVMYGQGLGPIQNRVFKVWVKRAFQRSFACSVRDQGSLKFLLDFGLSKEKIVLAADPVFQKKLEVNNKTNSKRLLLNIRPYSSWEEQKTLWLKHLALWQTQNFDLEFVPIGPGDREIGLFLQQEFPSLQVHPKLELENYAQVFCNTQLFISMRLHGLIFSALCNCLPVGINYDPKVAAISSQLQIPFWEIANLESLGRGVGQVLSREEEHRVDYNKALINLNIGAHKNRQVLAEALR